MPTPRLSVLPSAGSVLLGVVFVLLVGPLRARSDEAEIDRQKADLLLKLEARRAIERGLLWLTRQQRRDGAFRLETNRQDGPFPVSRHRFGETALATLTLADGGLGPDWPEVAKAIAYLRKHYRAYLKGDYWTQASSYSLSIFVLALHELYAQEAADDLADDRERYGTSIRRAKNPCRYPAWVAQAIERILDWLLESRSERGLFRYPGGFEGQGPLPPGGGGPGGAAPPPMQGPHHYGPEDLSNTQYVLLALWAGTRCGYEVDPAVLADIARRLVVWQETEGAEVQRVLDPVPDASGGAGRYGDMTRPKDVLDHARGFGYTPGATPTGSMTTAGLSSLAIVKAVLVETHGIDPALARLLDRGIWDAIAWLAHNFSVTGNPLAGPGPGARPSPLWHYYYLYGMERAGVILGKRFLGSHDWYREGARLLIDAQQADGAWRPPSAVGGWSGPGPGEFYDTSMLDTCFAILFLERGVMQPKRPLLPRPTVTGG